MIPSVASNALSVVGGQLISKIVRSALDDMLTRIDQSIETAINQGDNAIIGILSKTGEELRKSIDHFGNAYKDWLDYSIEGVSKEIQQSLTQLDDMVKEFESRNYAKVQGVISQAQMIVNMIPFTNKQAQLFEVKPRCVVATNINGLTQVFFHGNFFWASTNEKGWFGKDYTPTLYFGDKKCSLIHVETDDLEFAVPNSIFGNLPQRTYTKATGLLTLYWKNEGLVWSSREECFHHITLIALPQIAGTVTATFTSQQTTTTNQQKKFPQQVGPGAHRYEYLPDPGYHFDIQSITLVKSGNNYGVTTDFRPDKLICSLNLGTNQYARFSYEISVTQTITTITQQPNVTQTIDCIWNQTTILHRNQQTQNGNALTLSQFTFEDCRQRNTTFNFPYGNQGILSVNPGINGELSLRAEVPQDLNAFMN